MLKDTIIADMITAMKAQEEPKLSTLRMLKADIMKHEVSAKDAKATDEIVLQLVKRSIKQRLEAAEGFNKGGKPELAQKEMDEIKVLEVYMPEQASEEDVKKVVEEVIAQMKPQGPQDFGKVMGMAMGKLKNQADGNVVSKFVKELL